MTYTSIFEKILFLINMISTSWIYIAFVVVTLLLLVLLGLKKISRKKCFVLATLTTLLLLIYTIFIYYNPISKMTNHIIDNLFMDIYFPSTYVYLFVLLFINIVAIISLLNPKGEKIYKTVNGICFIVTDFVLALILEIIAKDKVDIFTKESFFSSTNLITLLEFSINTFIIWIIVLVAIYFINTITEHIIITKENKKLVSDPAVTITPELSFHPNDLQDEYQATTGFNSSPIKKPVAAIMPNEYKNKFIPDFVVSTKEVEEPVQNQFIPNINHNTQENSYNYNYNYNHDFDLSAFIPKKQENHPINSLTSADNTNQIFEQILNNQLPVIKEESKVTSSIEEVKDTYTLNDYRIFNKMLKDIREHNQSNSVTIDKNLEYRLITKYSTETYNMFKTMLKIYSN